MELLREVKSFLLNTWDLFWQDSLYYIILIVSLVLVIVLEKNKSKRIAIFWYSIIVAIILFNPFMYIIIQKAFNGSYNQYFCRFFLAIPMTIIIAYAIVLLANKFKKKIKYIIVAASIVILIILGDNIANGEYVTKAQNPEKVPPDVLQIAEIIVNDWEQKGLYESEGNPLVAMPTTCSPYIRQVENGIDVIYSRMDWFYPEIAQSLDSWAPDYSALFKRINRYSLDYVVSYDILDVEDVYAEKGYRVVGYSDNCIVFTKDEV